MAGPTIFLSAGEASGEHYGVSLIHAIRELLPDATFFGLGGERMEAAGLERIVRSEDVAVMGITEVIRHMPRIYGEYRKLKRSLKSQPHLPDAAVLIDFPGCESGSRPRTPPAAHSGYLFRQSSTLGVEETSDSSGAALCGQNAGHLSI